VPYDVYLSYAPADAKWVEDELRPRLKSAGLRVCDQDDFKLGSPLLVEVERLVRESNHTLSVLSPASVADENKKFETLLTRIQDPAACKRRLIPLKLHPCEVPSSITNLELVEVDFTGDDDRNQQFQRLLSSLQSDTLPVALSPRDPHPVPTIISLIGLELIRIPSGPFLMGSNWAPNEAMLDCEKPQHLVNLAEFYIGKYPVTETQYAVFLKLSSLGGSLPLKRAKPLAGREYHPAVEVSWHSAVAFCSWLSEETGHTLRLPSEAEWEKAARGTNGRLYPWAETVRPRDNVIGPEYSNYLDARFGGTTRVDAHPKGVSPYGVLDMAGNVWEWTRSFWGEIGAEPRYSYPYNPTDGRESPDVADDVLRVLRGGSYNSGASFVRCASRHNALPGKRLPDIGFRVVLLPEG
jgi:formylglycine-generating enzyme required for sulfatase activity